MHFITIVITLNDQTLNVEAAIGLKNVYVYFEEKLEDIDRTICVVYYVGEKCLYKHYVYTLSPGKTRLTLSDLLTGTYEVQVIQMSESERIEGKVRFDYYEPGLDLINLSEDIIDRLDAIQSSVEKQHQKNH